MTSPFGGNSNAFPTLIDPHDLNCALLLADNARAMLAEAFRLLKKDAVLSRRVELAGKAVLALKESTAARVDPHSIILH